MDESTLRAETDLIRQIESLLDDPAYTENPLREPLARLFEMSEGQRERLERLVRIADGYHQISRERSETLSEQYDRQLRRLEKLARISDRYQNNLRELSEALKAAALQDPLTGLGNRRYLMERLKEETERAERKQTPYSLIILDVDHFKLVNDRYGHEVGDQVLCEIAKAIRSGLREYDLCGRWGGEEFLVILPDTLLESARPVAERVRLAIKSIEPAAAFAPDVSARMSGFELSASLGLSTHRRGESYEETLNRSDEALRRAKEAGRDQVQVD